MQIDKTTKIYMILTIVVFWVILFMFFLLTNILPKKDFSEMENRYLKKKEVLTIESVFSGEFGLGFTKYLSDHIAFRDGLVMVKNEIEYLSGKREINGAYIGSEGQYFETLKDLNYLERNISHIFDFSKNFKDIEFIFIPAPSAYTIYSNLIPQYAPVLDEEIIKERISSKMKLIDTVKKLKEVKDKYIYFKTDHHWTQLGAYYAYSEYADNTGIKVENLSKYIEKSVSPFLGSLYSKVPFLNTFRDVVYYYVPTDYTQNVNIIDNNEMNEGCYYLPALDKKDKYTLFLGGNYGQIIIETNSVNEEIKEKNLLIIKDSFAHPLIPFLTAHFEKVIVLDMRFFKESVSKVIKKEKITDVIYIYNLSWFASDENIIRIK